MNNEDAFKLLSENENVADAARKYIQIFKIDESQFNVLKNRFSRLKLARITEKKNPASIIGIPNLLSKVRKEKIVSPKNVNLFQRKRQSRLQL